jgi:hypothetical protein
MSVPKVFNSRRNFTKKNPSASQAAVERNACPPAGCSEQFTEIDRPASSRVHPLFLHRARACICSRCDASELPFNAPPIDPPVRVGEPATSERRGDGRAASATAGRAGQGRAAGRIAPRRMASSSSWLVVVCGKREA